ncbi:hypothetical protein FPZ43_00105 [Mucilaginibacter pallidiroseus]|uniref:Uncharacterized protein n=1 Tax=Mucilaginibacter pallidiroseus TaxID=2599295 RepID=A0A563UHV4_9SPHI|nr:hypothetical protein [Mucilaginibacter pallidiroseus]TWR30921.1 hypothetical protein FPZ43_00105 [Mucilaginibacter pallidiroseus]
MKNHKEMPVHPPETNQLSFDEAYEQPQTADASAKSSLGQDDINKEIKTFSPPKNGHMALETKEGKNNGALPKAYQNQKTNRP